MINSQDRAEYISDAASALNRVLAVAGIETWEVRPIGGHVESDGHARRRINSAIYALPDGIARTVAVSAWAVFGEVLSQTGRGDMANERILDALVSALTDHAHMIEGASAVQAVERAMRQGLSQAPSPRRHGQHRRK
ncbi:hypothetical protein [Nonomuraea angiospora]